MKKTWKERPTIINKIPVDNEAMILFIDESGEGNSKILKRAFQDKITGVNYKQRNDLFILNGVVMTGKEHINLTNRFNELKEIVSNDGVFNYEKKGIRPILLRNHNIEDKNPPFNNLKPEFFEKLNRIIYTTNYKQISSGINYYTYTQRHYHEDNASPLLMALGIILINYADYLNSIDKKGIIIFEEETEKHDTLKLSYIRKVLFHGNKTFKAEYFKNISAVYFRKKWTKEDNKEFTTTPGLELADLTISPLRRILHPEFQLIEKKLYNYPNYNNKGFSVIG